MNTDADDAPADPAGPRMMAAADGTPYMEAFNDAAPEDVRGAVDDGVLLWSVPWRGPGPRFFELYDTRVGPVLKTDIFIGWAYAWDWPGAAAAVRHVRRHTAELDLAEGYLRYPRVVILLAGPWGTVIEQNRDVRAILHTEHGPETRWYPGRQQALEAAAAHVRDACAWAARLRGSDPGARAAERREAIEAADAAIAALTPDGQADGDPADRATRDAAQA